MLLVWRSVMYWWAYTTQICPTLHEECGEESEASSRGWDSVWRGTGSSSVSDSSSLAPAAGASSAPSNCSLLLSLLLLLLLVLLPPKQWVSWCDVITKNRAELLSRPSSVSMSCVMSSSVLLKIQIQYWFLAAANILILKIFVFVTRYTQLIILLQWPS